jgi:hypothetical protein
VQGLHPKSISSFDKGLLPNEFPSLAQPKSSGLMVDNPEKEIPLTLGHFNGTILALTYKMQTLLNVTKRLRPSVPTAGLSGTPSYPEKALQEREHKVKKIDHFQKNWR